MWPNCCRAGSENLWVCILNLESEELLLAKSEMEEENVLPGWVGVVVDRLAGIHGLGSHL